MNFTYAKRYLRNNFFFKTPLYLTYFKYFIDRHKELLINNETEYLIEGFPRSGNSFLVFYLKQLSKKISIASHTHHPAHVFKAIKDKKKIIIVIRDPIDAIVSLYLFYNKEIYFNLLINEYISFYKAIQKFKNKFIIIEFKNIIKNPKKVIKMINSRNKEKLKYAYPDKKKIFRKLKKHSITKFNILDKYQSDFLKKEYEREKKNIKKVFYKEIRKEKINILINLYKSFIK